MTKLANRLKVQLPLALGFSLISCYSIKLPAFSTAQPANPETTSAIQTNDGTVKPAAPNIAIANISLNENKQLVIEFDNPEHISPSQPQVKDYPGQKHDIVLEFTQTSFAVDKAPKAKAVLEELSKVYPNLTAVAYATALDGTRARIRFGVASNVEAHPTLIKVDKDSAIIDLNISQTEVAIASNDTNSANTEQPKITSNEEPKAIAEVAKATTPASPIPTPEKGVKTKTVDGIKGAWTSSLGKLAKTNPLSKFGHGKSTEHLSVPTNTDITPASTEALAQTKEETVTEKSPDTIATNTTSSASEITPTPPAPDTTASASDKISLLRPEIVPPAESTTLTPAESISPAPSANTASVISTEITTPPGNIVSSAAAEAASAAPQVEPPKQEQVTSIALNRTTVERIRTELPRIPVTTEGKPAEESIITPLSVEQVLKEKASLQTAAESKPAIPAAPAENSTTSPPVAVEAKSDNSIASDLKTGFSNPITDPVPESTDKDKKDEAEKIASVPANPLDNLTNAAINNAGTEVVEDKTTSANTVKLRAQKAHVGGKDYFPPKFSDEAIEHYNAAVRAHLDGKLTEAITEYKEAIDADEKISEAYSNLGLIYNQMHKHDLAMAEFHKALALNPNDAITYNGIGAAMRAKNNLLAAIKNWQTAITIDPNLASAHYNLGTAYELNKDLDKALAQYKEAVKHDDKLGEAYYRMGLILQKMNNKNLALQEYKQAVKISQQASYVLDAKRRINLLSAQNKNQPM